MAKSLGELTLAASPKPRSSHCRNLNQHREILERKIETEGVAVEVAAKMPGRNGTPPRLEGRGGGIGYDSKMKELLIVEGRSSRWRTTALSSSFGSDFIGLECLELRNEVTRNLTRRAEDE